MIDNVLNFPDFSEMFNNVLNFPDCSEMFQKVLLCSRGFYNVLEGSKM